MSRGCISDNTDIKCSCSKFVKFKTQNLWWQQIAYSTFIFTSDAFLKTTETQKHYTGKAKKRKRKRISILIVLARKSVFYLVKSTASEIAMMIALFPVVA